MVTITISTERFYALLQVAGREINPETAEVEWWYAQTLDPYGVHDLPEEYQQIGREYFASSPGTDLWISFHDLPKATRDAAQFKASVPSRFGRIIRSQRRMKADRAFRWRVCDAIIAEDVTSDDHAHCALT